MKPTKILIAVFVGGALVVAAVRAERSQNKPVGVQEVKLLEEKITENPALKDERRANYWEGWGWEGGRRERGRYEREGWRWERW